MFTSVERREILACAIDHWLKGSQMSGVRVSGCLPSGVRLISPETHRDRRGTFTEIFRQEWEAGPVPVQWNLVFSRARVLRGVHVHLRHTDYVTVAEGRATVGLYDLRAGSVTEGCSTVLELRGHDRVLLLIPPGVAHGFYFHTDALGVYAVSEYWNLDDELGCHWADPDLHLAWPATDAIVSDRDAALPPVAELKRQVAARFASEPCFSF